MAEYLYGAFDKLKIINEGDNLKKDMIKDGIPIFLTGVIFIIIGMAFYFFGVFTSTSNYDKASGMAMFVSLIPIAIGFFCLPQGIFLLAQGILPKSRIYKYLGCIISAILFFMFLLDTNLIISWTTFSYGSFYGVPNSLIIGVIVSLIYLYIAIKFITDD